MTDKETAMSALAAEPEAPHGQGWDDLVRLWEGTDAPEGCKVEIIEGIITVAPPPSNDHNLIADLVQEVLYAAKPKDWGVYQTLGLVLPSKKGLYIPDLVLAERADLAKRPSSLPADRAKLVVEITSESNANHDRIAKVHGYADAGVPLYLLLDSWHSARPTFTLYGEPADGTYRALLVGEFGEKLVLPEPFGCDIDTSAFPVA
ncbi:Uma2 family endonuclease [Streptomyces sp. 8L]|uniref:Uma2 family endonuclease n=1 Tax=Streptomyces sp. 8L TaxID=2877242 RepID=UPI001CD2580D|nr:Uma2 family endonuclease [Streptomyces sp. 8L]MCA1222603.1 Uma2 family endonuclease [Streptomyces sp. 8L]